MQILDSIIEGALTMPDRSESDALIVAVVRFLATGEVPEGLTGYARSSWAMIEPVLANSRQKAESGRRGGKSRSSRSASKRPSKQPSKTQSETGSCASLSSSSSYFIPKEGVQGEEEEPFEPPTEEECREYFGANFLKGDPSAFRDFYASQGWVKGNGRPVEDWRALARMWHRKQTEIDADRAAKGEPTPDEAKWRPSKGYDPDAEYERRRREYAEKYGDAALAELERSMNGADS